MVVLILTDIVQFVNVGKTMNPDQISRTADIIIKDYYYYKLEDFKLFSEQFIKGVYGKLFDRLDGTIILEALEIYDFERTEQAQHESDLKHEQNLQGRVNGVVNPEGQKKVIEALKTVVESVKPEAKPEPEKKKPQQTEREKFIQSCLMEHYKVWLKKPYKPKIQPSKEVGIVINPDVSGRFILYKEQVVDEMEYVKLKLAEFDSLIKENKDLEL